MKPESTAVRVALWRALHVEVDSPPPVLNDTVGLQLVAPDENWRQRPDMHPEGTKFFRASIVARARFIEDLITARAAQGVRQYVLLGAGIDTFAQRRPEVASRLNIFEVDQSEPQAWKKQRLIETGYSIPAGLHFVPVNFEAQESWWEKLLSAGFDPKQPAVVASTGVSMYLTKETTKTTLRQLATLAPGSAFAMTFMRPLEWVEDEIRPILEAVSKNARGSGTPFISFYTPPEILELAREAGFQKAEHITAELLTKRYFAGRADGLRTINAEEILLVTAGVVDARLQDAK